MFVCFDPGIRNVGFCWGSMNSIGSIDSIDGLECVDMTIMTHKRVSTEDCCLSHGSHIQERVAHFLQEWGHLIHEASIVLVELQPFQSAGKPFEILLKERYGSKVVLIPPRSIHKALGMGGYTYEGRKKISVTIASDFLEALVAKEVKGAPEALKAMGPMDRKHDCADAILLLIYYIYHFTPVKTKRKPRETLIVKRSKYFIGYNFREENSPSLVTGNPKRKNTGDVAKDKETLSNFSSFLQQFKYCKGES